MEAISTKYILAVVEIPNLVPLEELADKLGMAIDGIIFRKEESGRFEEVPAFIAEDKNSNAKFILFGIPEGEFGNAYTLEFSAETDGSIQNFKKSTFKFLNCFDDEKGANPRGFFDYSNELATALRIKGIRAFKPTD